MRKVESSEIIVEPTDRVIEALKLATGEIGLSNFLKKVRIDVKTFDDWISKKEWIPIYVIREACNIIKKIKWAPNSLKFLYTCIENAQIKSIKGLVK